MWLIWIILTWILHRRTATTPLGNHNKTVKSYINHRLGVKTTYLATATNKRLIFFLRKGQSIRSYLAVTNLEHLQLESTDSTKTYEKFGSSPHKISQGRLLHENWPKKAWTCENSAHWCLHQKTNQSCERLCWIKFVQKNVLRFQTTRMAILKFRSSTWSIEQIKL